MAPLSTKENSRALRRRGGAWRPLALAFGAALSCLGTLWVYRYFVRTPEGQTFDALALAQAAAMGGGRLDKATSAVLDQLPTVSLVVAAIIVGLVAFAGKRWAPALWAVVAAVVANLATQLLKNFVFDRPDLGVDSPLGNSLPSGHTTIAASAAAAVTLAVAPRWRPLAAVLGGTFAFVSGASTVVNLWHRPADVIAALLVVGCASALAAIPVVILDGRGSRGVPSGAAKVLSSHTVWGVATGVLTVLGAVAAVVIPLLPAGSLSVTGSAGVDTRAFWSGVALCGATAYGLSWLGIQLLSRRKG
ncbi:MULTISPECIES: phosphatase PAP2 family protein [Arthrobacter]|uniref:Phosphatase PAP2 family protein n=2 Tax=Arthrobacter TaxID=1663 RepID=A0ABU9KKT5_9MICC|nr:phosphatase PAP2 family protein [Arthrobacter sp. YJM1]MDP5227514.1 phosphatase PAP2 family protein [Arthrobacter sp. YJM1]